MEPQQKQKLFRDLHKDGCFVIANPWNIGTAKYLQSIGYKAIATTSAGLAHANGLADGEVTLEMTLDHLRGMAKSTDIPLSADFENGFAHNIDDLVSNVKLCVETGIAGISIEDATGDLLNPLYPFDVAVERLRAARRAIDETGIDVFLTARADGFIKNRPDFDEILRRLVAFADAGADCLFAPGINDPELIRAIVKAVAPKPINFLMSSATNLSVSDIAALGVRRISVGGSLSRVAWTAFTRSAREIAEQGSFNSFNNTMQVKELDALFK
jgi:2-methylisocitrate lyase-like PEP mutase family enzyme